MRAHYETVSEVRYKNLSYEFKPTITINFSIFVKSTKAMFSFLMFMNKWHFY